MSLYSVVVEFMNSPEKNPRKLYTLNLLGWTFIETSVIITVFMNVVMMHTSLVNFSMLIDMFNYYAKLNKKDYSLQRKCIDLKM